MAKNAKEYYASNSQKWKTKWRYDWENLSDAYVKKVIIGEGSILSYSEIPQELVDVKREHLRLQRMFEQVTGKRTRRR